MTKKILSGVALVLFATPAVSAQHVQLRGLDDLVLKAVHDWGVPGVAIAVVKDHTVIYLKGFGVRKIGEPVPVDEDTIFVIGSATSPSIGVLRLALALMQRLPSLPIWQGNGFHTP